MTADGPPPRVAGRRNAGQVLCWIQVSGGLGPTRSAHFFLHLLILTVAQFRGAGREPGGKIPEALA